LKACGRMVLKNLFSRISPRATTHKTRTHASFNLSTLSSKTNQFRSNDNVLNGGTSSQQTKHSKQHKHFAHPNDLPQVVRPSNTHQEHEMPAREGKKAKRKSKLAASIAEHTNEWSAEQLRSALTESIRKQAQSEKKLKTASSAPPVTVDPDTATPTKETVRKNLSSSFGGDDSDTDVDAGSVSNVNTNRARVTEKSERNRRLQAFEKFKPSTIFNAGDKTGVEIYKFTKSFRREYDGGYYDPEFAGETLIKHLLKDPTAGSAVSELVTEGVRSWKGVVAALHEAFGSSNAVEVQESELSGLRQGVDESVRVFYHRVKTNVEIWNDIVAGTDEPEKGARDVKRFFSNGLSGKRGNTHSGLKSEVAMSCESTATAAQVLKRAIHLEEVEEKFIIHARFAESEVVAAAGLEKSTKPTAEEITVSKTRRTTYGVEGKDVLERRSKRSPKKRRREESQSDDSGSDEAEGVNAMYEKRKRFDPSLRRGGPGTSSGNAGPKLPCFQFQSAGSCSYGNACRFLHEKASLGHAAPSPAARGFARPPAANNGFGSQVGNNGCRDFERGRCTRGSSCKYAHGQPQSAQGPPPRPRSFAPFTHPNNTPQSPHRFGRPPSASNIAGSSSGAMLPCRDFARGVCRYGGSCRFKH
jgi:hypothetical protein